MAEFTNEIYLGSGYRKSKKSNDVFTVQRNFAKERCALIIS